MPPIMGAAAFVMAEFLGVGYGQVIVWALIPSILYYLACFGAVHFEAKRKGLVGVPRSELPMLGNVMRERGHLFIPVAADPADDVSWVSPRRWRRWSATLRMLSGGDAAGVHARQRRPGRTSSMRWSTAPATRSPWRSPAPAPASSSAS